MPDSRDTETLAEALAGLHPFPQRRLLRLAETALSRTNRARGEVLWLCVTPAGGKSDHPTEQAALNRAAQHAGSVVYPAVVEIEEAS